MCIYKDQLNREINLPAMPARIISLVPSQTELLFELGLEERITGITKFCIHPAGKVTSVAKIGGTKQLDIAKIKSLNPDLIIANKEENERSQIEELMQHYPVWISDITCLGDAIDMIYRVGEITGKKAEAEALGSEIKRGFDGLTPSTGTKRVVYLIWRKPYMAAGQRTFITDMLQRCGFINGIAQARYPEITAEELKIINPDLILLSSEPYPFAEKHIAEFKTIVPSAEVKLVDGEMFSWYGSRLKYAPGYFGSVVTRL